MTNPGCYSGREHIYDKPVNKSPEKKKSRIVFQKRYDWESLYDLESDMIEAFNDSNPKMEGIPGEFTGTIIVTMTYEEDEE